MTGGFVFAPGGYFAKSPNHSDGAIFVLLVSFKVVTPPTHRAVQSLRGVYLGLTILLRLAGLAVVAPVRGILTIFWFIRDRAAEAAEAAATRFGLPSPLRVALEGYRDRGLAGISPHLDYRR